MLTCFEVPSLSVAQFIYTLSRCVNPAISDKQFEPEVEYLSQCHCQLAFNDGTAAPIRISATPCKCRTAFSPTCIAVADSGILARRNLFGTVLQLSAPVISLAMVALFVAASENGLLYQDSTGTEELVSGSCTGRGLERPVTHIPDCRTNVFLDSRNCVAFVYAPANDSFVRSIVAGIQRHNAPSIPDDQVSYIIC